MGFSEALNYCLYIALTVLLPIVATHTVSLIKAKIKESHFIAGSTQNAFLNKMVESALSDVMDAVLYINQVYVDSLKSSGTFDKAAQEEAFNRAYAEATNMISNGSKKAIEGLYGSFDKWLQIKIESSVNMAKK